MGEQEKPRFRERRSYARHKSIELIADSASLNIMIDLGIPPDGEFAKEKRENIKAGLIQLIETSIRKDYRENDL